MGLRSKENIHTGKIITFLLYRLKDICFSLFIDLFSNGKKRPHKDAAEGIS